MGLSYRLRTTKFYGISASCRTWILLLARSNNFKLYNSEKLPIDVS